MDVREEAQGMIDKHGRRAQQFAVDQIVAAIRRGDDGEATRLGGVLRAIEVIGRENQQLEKN